jgi:regulator of replication initiation timing
MRQLLDFRVNSLAASWMLDLHNMRLSFSPEFYSKFGFGNLKNQPVEFLLDEWVSEYVVSEDRRRLNEMLFSSFQSGNESDKSKLIEFEIINPQGVLVPVQMSLMVINDELGRAKTLFGGIYNLSEQKAVKNLQLLLSQERKLNEEKLALQEKELMQKSTELSDLQGLNTQLSSLCAELEAKLANFKATNNQLMQANEALTAEIAELKQKYSAAAVEEKTSEKPAVVRNKKQKVRPSEEKTIAVVVAETTEKAKSIRKPKSGEKKMLSSNLGGN